MGPLTVDKNRNCKVVLFYYPSNEALRLWNRLQNQPSHGQGGASRSVLLISG